MTKELKNSDEIFLDRLNIAIFTATILLIFAFILIFISFILS